MSVNWPQVRRRYYPLYPVMIITSTRGREVNGEKSWDTSVVVSPRIIMTLLLLKFIYRPIQVFEGKIYWKSDMCNITVNELSGHERTATKIGRNSWIDECEGKMITTQIFVQHIAPEAATFWHCGSLSRNAHYKDINKKHPDFILSIADTSIKVTVFRFILWTLGRSIVNVHWCRISDLHFLDKSSAILLYN